jgi:glycerol-3-phosphate acyltransferase PlsY
VLLVIAFVAGSIPFGVIVAKRKGVDIRARGSGNIGATNVGRVLGARAGVTVLLLDAAKGALPVALAMHVGATAWMQAATGAAAILGHCFSPLLGGRGGKGVATAFGVFVVLAPVPAAIAVVVFAIVARATRVPALGSLAGVAAIAIVLVHGGDVPRATLAVATAALLVYTHRSNLAKLTT